MKAIPALVLNERANAASHTLPPLLVEAERIAATVMQGVHGRKRAGPGESFWQYRALRLWRFNQPHRLAEIGALIPCLHPRK